MPPPLTPAEREEYRRIAREEARAVAEERARPIEQKLARHSGKFLEVREEVSPAVARQIAESQHETEDRSIGFEQYVMRSLASNARANEAIQELAIEALEVARRTEGAIQPRAIVQISDGHGNKSIQPASIVAAESSVRTEMTVNQTLGQTKALQVGVENADTNSLAAKRAGQRALITNLVTAVIVGIWAAYQFITAHAAP